MASTRLPETIVIYLLSSEAADDVMLKCFELVRSQMSSFSFPEGNPILLQCSHDRWRAYQATCRLNYQGMYLDEALYLTRNVGKTGISVSRRRSVSDTAQKPDKTVTLQRLKALKDWIRKKLIAKVQITENIKIQQFNHLQNAICRTLKSGVARKTWKAELIIFGIFPFPEAFF